jgi:ribosome recycling factor
MAERTIERSNAKIRVFRPELTAEEREKRMKLIYKAAESLLLSKKEGGNGESIRDAN